MSSFEVAKNIWEQLSKPQKGGIIIKKILWLMNKFSPVNAWMRRCLIQISCRLWWLAWIQVKTEWLSLKRRSTCSWRLLKKRIMRLHRTSWCCWIKSYTYYKKYWQREDSYARKLTTKFDLNCIFVCSAVARDDCKLHQNSIWWTCSNYLSIFQTIYEEDRQSQNVKWIPTTQVPTVWWKG